MPRILTLWFPRWPVQRRLVGNAALRHVPVFVCQRQPRGVMTVLCWAWALPPPARADSGDPRAGAGCAINAGMPLAEAMAVLACAHGSQACTRAWIDHDDPVADRAALLEIARWCRRFTPAVAVEGGGGEPAGGESRRPECLHLDVTATAGFFGGELRLVRTAVWTLAARGLQARGAIADTPGAAWAAAHHTDRLVGLSEAPPARGRRRRSVVVKPGGHLLQAERSSDAAGTGEPGSPVPAGAAFTPHQLVDALPATGLRLEGPVLEKLREVGVDSIGGVLRLPRRSLASRFGPQLVRRLAEYMGERAEPLEMPGGGELPQISHTFDFPLALRRTSEEQFAVVVRPLLEACVRPLVSAGHGVTALQVRLERARSAGGLTRQAEGTGGTVAPVVIDVGLYRPSVSVAHLGELIRLRMSRMSLPKEIDGVSIEVVAAGEVGSRQRLLFGEADEASGSQVTLLLERLAGRLGRAAVFEPRAVADAQPEHAWIAVPPGQAGRLSGSVAARPKKGRGESAGAEEWGTGMVASRPPAPERRPMWMLARPVRLEGVHQAPPGRGTPGVPVRFRYESRVHRVLCAQGPERIETAWWRGRSVRRDYFVVEAVHEVEGSGDRGGGDDSDRTRSVEGILRLWVFRQVREGGWFVHGVFA